PVANDDTAMTALDTPVEGNLLTNDFDLDGDNIILNTTPITNPENGLVVINLDGTYTYTPNSGFVGLDSFIYEICDDGVPSMCDTAVVYIIVMPENGNTNDTYANDDAYNGDSGLAITGNVLDNDFDPEGDIQTVNTTPVVGVTNGIVVLNSNGTFNYTPTLGFTGTDSFVYEVCDNGSPIVCDQATVVITI
ncbi:Ig-like domain-containing protein, partial [uncultured Lutibacter sp.]|uniref:Ig-like domain-containing protein n=1 Tax=uncultured Lutibacter sp. TaxID=437739 RepID=UPI0026373E94